MKWAISLVIALVLNVSSSAFADSLLSLVAEPAHTGRPSKFQQSLHHCGHNVQAGYECF